MMGREDRWPRLPLEEWQDTYATLHLWTQIVGKIRLSRMPWINHSWHVTLYVTPRGLTTGPIPHGATEFQIDFDFLDHRLLVQSSDGDLRSMVLEPRSVADFYEELMAALAESGLDVAIYAVPNEVPDPVPFADDHEHDSYDARYARDFWRVLARSDQVLKQFRARFIGKCSPVHFFWGACDLAVTRFSGRQAPLHPGGLPNLPDWVTREAYSHEVSSCGFWPGGGPLPYPLFYAYAYPEPQGFKEAPVSPSGAFYSEQMSEFVLPYEDMRTADSPEETLSAFLQSTYEAAADLAAWNRRALERAAEPGPES